MSYSIKLKCDFRLGTKSCFYLKFPNQQKTQFAQMSDTTLLHSHDITFFAVCTDYTGYCPDTCTGLFNPVCGRDGKIYLNRCQLFKKACATNNDWLYEVINRTCFDGMFILIRFIVNSIISQIWCIVELERGQHVSTIYVFWSLFNPTIHQICDILLLAINFMFILNIMSHKMNQNEPKWQKPSCFTC